MAHPPNKSLHLSSEFCISSGTCTLDLLHSRVLLIKWRKTNEIFLPKGRKHISETLEAAALRETWEETGYRAKLLPLPFVTLATTPSSFTEDGKNTELVTEPIAVSQRTLKDGTLKIIFWFAAHADSTLEQDRETQQEGEDFETLWVSLDKFEGVMTFEDDKKIVRAVVDAASRILKGR